MQGLEATFDGTWAQRGPDVHGFGDAFELSCPEVLQLENIAEKPSCALGNNDRVRLGESLQTRREVRRLADDAMLLRGRRSDQVADHNQAGRNADSGLQ